MKLYLVKLVFHVQREGTSGEEEFEEQYWTIPARQRQIAFETGRKLGLSEEATIKTPGDERIHWKFIDVAEVLEPGDHQASKLLFTNTSVLEHGESYIQHVKARAIHLQVKNLNFV